MCRAQLNAWIIEILCTQYAYAVKQDSVRLRDAMKCILKAISSRGRKNHPIVEKNYVASAAD